MGPSCQEEETFFQLNKEELSLHATMDLVGSSRKALHVQSSSDDSLCCPRYTERSEVVDDGEAPDGMTRRWEDTAVESQIESRRRVITGSGAAWGCSRWRITKGVEGWRDSLAGDGVALHNDAC